MSVHSENEPDEAADLGQKIRDLLDPYVPPPDPYFRVLQRVRARRACRRAVAGLAAAAAAVTAVAVAGFGLMARGGTTIQFPEPAEPAAPAAERATGPQFADFGDRSPLGPAYVVARGSTDERAYIVASVNFGAAGRTCVYADDAVFAQLSLCFTAEPGRLGTWARLGRIRSGPAVVAIGGVVDARTSGVTVRTDDGRKLPVTAVRTPTSTDLAFFALVLPGSARIAAVTATDGNGGTVTLPQDGPDPCQPAAGAGCATRPPGAS